MLITQCLQSQKNFVSVDAGVQAQPVVCHKDTQIGIEKCHKVIQTNTEMKSMGTQTKTSPRYYSEEIIDDKKDPDFKR